MTMTPSARVHRGTALTILILSTLVAAGCATPEPPDAEPVQPEPATETRQLQEAPAMDEFIRDPAGALGVEWQWVSTTTPVEEIRVDEPERYSILLRPDGKMAGRFDCNRGGGDYEIGEGRLSFGPMMSTRAMCPPDSLDTRFMKDLGLVNSFFMRGGELYLEMPADGGTLRFRRAPEK